MVLESLNGLSSLQAFSPSSCSLCGSSKLRAFSDSDYCLELSSLRMKSSQPSSSSCLASKHLLHSLVSLEELSYCKFARENFLKDGKCFARALFCLKYQHIDFYHSNCRKSFLGDSCGFGPLISCR